MLEWYKALPAELSAAVHGFTLLNEPGLGLVPGGAPRPRPGVTPLSDNAPVVAWLTAAVHLYMSELGGLLETAGAPLLYMNLHESAFPPTGNQSSIFAMAAAAAAMGLAGRPWAVFDVHHYFSWTGGGSGIPAENCSSNDVLKAFVDEGMANFIGSLRAAARSNNLRKVACSEWSLSLHHKDWIAPCTAADPLTVMHDTQLGRFATAGVANFFWGWRMPNGGVHEDKWSLKYHLTGMH